MSDFDVFPAKSPIGLSAALARTAQTRGSHPSTIFKGTQRTWAETNARVDRAAAALRAMGVKPGDRVALLALLSDRFFELMAAICRAGGIFVPLNWRWSVPELADALTDCEPAVLFYDERMAEPGRALAKGRPEMVVASLSEGLDGLPFYESLLVDHDPGPEVVRGGDDGFSLGYTGGTTGRSKAAIVTHRNVLTMSLSCQAEGILCADSVFFVTGPMFHVAGTFPALALIVGGGTGVLIEQYEPTETLRLIEKHKVTETLLVPTVLSMTIECPDFAQFDTSSLKTIMYGGAPITEALLDRVTAKLPHTELVQIYGMTELAGACTMLPHKYLLGENRARGLNTATGRAMPGMHMRVVDENDQEVPHGEIGEITIRSDTVMKSYWRRPEETAQALRNGWMHTGDGGYMNEEGLIYIVDRMKDMIISGGENIYSTEVENAVASHRAVKEVVVIGIPSEKWGESVHAVVRLHDGASATEAEIIAHVRTRLAGYKSPRSVEFRVEPFPVSPANKVLKREIRLPYWEGRSKTIV